MSDKPQILPPEKRPTQTGRFAVPTLVKTLLRWGLILALLGWAGWSLQNFFQLRGIVNVPVSRINLAFLCVSLFVVFWLLTPSFARKALWRTVAALVLLLITSALDWWAPKPTTPLRPAPLITMEIHPSPFPVSLPPGSTLRILPLHPYQTFTPAPRVRELVLTESSVALRKRDQEQTRKHV